MGFFKKLLFSSAIFFFFFACSQVAHSTDNIPLEPVHYEAPFSTDRPSFTASTETIPKGYVQVEMGSTWQNPTRQNSQRFQSVTLPEAVTRYGITNSSEFQFFAPNFIQTFGNNDTSGFGDLKLGLKQKLPLTPAGIQLTLYPTLTLPTGANNQSANSVNPDFNLLASKEITNQLSLASQLGVLLNPSGKHASRITINPTLMLNFAASQNIGLFAEYASFNQINAQSKHVLDFGMTYLIKKHHQIDLRVGTGLTKDTPSLFAGAGYAFRVGTHSQK